jgi:hypothetical protein
MRHTGLALAALAVLAVLSLAVVGACGDAGSAGGGTGPGAPGGADITGTISGLNGGTSFLVVADAVVLGGVDRAFVRITPDTTLWTAAGEGRRSLSPGGLSDGLRVAVRFAGPVAESYPVQATAADVQVLSGF